MIPRKFTELHPMVEVASNVGQGYPLPSIIRLVGRKSVHASPLHLWYISLVHNGFAKRKLTVPSDKLLAISALARYWSQYIPGPYLAGLWHCRLWWALCWRRTGSLATRPVKYRCPS
jgi:hypothetical protein